MSRHESSTTPTLRLKTSTLYMNMHMNRTPHSLGNTPVTISPEKDILDAFKGPYCGWHWVYEPRKEFESTQTNSSSTQITSQPTSAPLEYTYSSSSSTSSRK